MKNDYQDELKFLKKILASLPGHIYWTNKKGEMIGSNENQWRDLGCSSIEELIGKSVYEFQPKDIANILIRNDKKVMSVGKAETFEEPSFDKDGKKRMYISHKIPLKDSKDNVIGLIGTSMDITDLKEREKTLEKAWKEVKKAERIRADFFLQLSEEVMGLASNKEMSIEDQVLAIRNYFESMIALMPGHIYWMNINNVFMGSNNLQATSAGLKSRKEIEGKTLYDMPWSDQAEKIIAINNQVMQQGKPTIIEETSALASGKIATFLSHKVPLKDKKGKVIGLLGVSIDITEQKEIEQQLKEEKIKTAIQHERIETMKTVSANIAHELRTPLGSINVGANGLGKTLPALFKAYHFAKEAGLPIDTIRPQQYKVLENIVDELQKETQMANMIINMLLMNIKGGGIDQSQFEKLSMVDCIREALERYPFQNSEERKLIDFDVSNDFNFHGNKIYFTHVLFNLIKNAVYFVLKAGKGRISLRLKPNDKKNILYFKDTGTGIPAEILPKIFDNFFTSREGEGTGVGLPFCKSVMHALSGEILCESKQGEYTEFKLVFPKIT